MSPKKPTKRVSVRQSDPRPGVNKVNMKFPFRF